MRTRAKAELQAGAYASALTAARKVLDKDPKDGLALQYEKEAKEKLLAELKTLGLASSGAK